MKKLLYSAVGVAAFLAVAAPAMATWTWPSNDVNVENEHTKVITKVTTKADAGDNSISGKFVWGGKITSGDAVALADVQTMANYTEVNACGSCLKGDVKVENEHTFVLSKVYTKADSGDNSIHGMMVGFHPEIVAGGALASSVVGSQVNLTMVGDFVKN